MLKVRLIAAAISLVLTALTLPLLWWIYKHFLLWYHHLTASQLQMFNISQAILGLSVAAISFWWVKRKKKSEQDK